MLAWLIAGQVDSPDDAGQVHDGGDALRGVDHRGEVGDVGDDAAPRPAARRPPGRRRGSAPPTRARAGRRAASVPIRPAAPVSRTETAHGSRPMNSTRNCPSRPAAALPAAMTSSCVELLAGDPGGGVGDQRQPEHLHAGGAGGDRLQRGRHADQVGAERAQHPDLGRRLVVRPGQRRVDALDQRRVELAGPARAAAAE